MTLLIAIIGLATPIIGFAIWWYKKNNTVPTIPEQVFDISHGNKKALEYVQELIDKGNLAEAERIVRRLRNNATPSILPVDTAAILSARKWGQQLGNNAQQGLGDTTVQPSKPKGGV